MRQTLSIRPVRPEENALHREHFGQVVDVDAYVVTMPEGGPRDYAYRRKRYRIPATKAIGLPGLAFHDLRRATATALVNAGVDLKTAPTRLGHSDPRLTLAVCAQATTAADRETADRVAELLMTKSEEDSGPSSGVAENPDVP